MSHRTYLALFVFGLILPILISLFQPIPGYLDSDYYFAGGIQLATGKGFTEPYLWNYLDGTSSLPHPSHSYWMPLASIVAALGMRLAGQTTFHSARLFFIFIAALVPPVTCRLAFTFSRKRELAVTSGLLAIFSVYHAPFVGVTDNFGIFMLLGGLYMLIATRIIEKRGDVKSWFGLGLLSGLMALSRSDGVLWLLLTVLLVLLQIKNGSPPKIIKFVLLNGVASVLGFLLIMFPWYARNLTIFGSLMAPGGSRVLWLDNYDQTFIYPPDQLTMESFLSLGWKEILSDRFWALKLNLQSGFAAHGGIVLFPFILLGLFSYRQDERVKIAVIAWLILIVVMTVVFPFAGARGSFFHAGAALQPLWWTLAPLGLEKLLSLLRERGWGNDQTRVIFRSALVMMVMILTIFVVYLRVFSLGWGEGEDEYPAVEQFLVAHGIEPSDRVIVRNAPGYYIATGRSALSIPYGGEQAILEVSRVFGAEYLVVEPEAALKSIRDLYHEPTARSTFMFLGEVNETRIYRISSD